MYRRSVSLAVVAALFVALNPSPLLASAPGVNQARDWLLTQQQADGGFETAGFPGFETPDAVLALASAAQTSSVYDAVAANAAVVSAVANGKTPLDNLDDLSESTPSAAKAAELIVVADRLGIDPSAFDPQSDGSVDLVMLLTSALNPDGSFGPAGAFNATLLAMIALDAVGAPIDPATINFVRAAQREDGGWNFAGTVRDSTASDVDTTGRALQALAAAGVTPTDPAVRQGSTFLALQQNAQGAWGGAPGEINPNTTAFAILGIRASGYDPDDSCWRRVAAPTITSTYISPDDALLSVQAADGHFASPFDSFGVNTSATSQAVQAIARTALPITISPSQPCPDPPSGTALPVDLSVKLQPTAYSLVTSNGAVHRFSVTSPAAGPGAQPYPTTLPYGPLNEPIVGASRTTDSGGWLFAGDGGVFSFGAAPFFGSAGGIKLNQPVVAGGSMPDGNGYFLAASDGGVFTFGTSTFQGSLGGQKLNQPIVAATATASGNGYFLFAADGGVFTFGDATFVGSLADRKLNQPIVAAMSTKDGYILVAADGGVFTFGNAIFHGSMGGQPLNQPIVSADINPTAQGYALLGRDGGVFTFGNVPFVGGGTNLIGDFRAILL